MIKSNPNPKRYHDLEFIIPFLINHSTQVDSSVKKKRASVPSRVAEMNHNSSREVVRIYKPMRKATAGKAERRAQLQRQRQKEKEKEMERQREKELPRNKIVSQLQLSLHHSPYVVKNRFYKAQSVSNHIPVHLTEQPPLNHLPLSTQKATEHSPIPGIRFKKRSMFHQSASIITPQFHPDDFIQYKSQATNKIKEARDKNWDKKRCANVDFIINRKCKTFNQLIAEYRRRMGIETVNKIFIFNSKDFWLRRVLLDRGWLQNQNKDSRAFHLIWSSRVYKERMFPEQLANHYRSSDLLTSKTGLHRMLLKYSLTDLQPKTFDLTLQRQQFATYYAKLAFLGKLATVISKFQFQDGPIFSNFQEIRQQLMMLRSKQDEKGHSAGLIQEELFCVVESCMFLLQNKVERINMYAVDHVLFIVHSSLVLSPTEEELIRMARDFNELAQKAKLFEKDLQNGSENLWLTKSKTSSKGVGISLHKDYDSIVKHQHRLAQKYIQNPLIFNDPSIKGRKFDIRIWVLLVGSSRAKVYYHDKFYGRLCYEAYSLETINLDNEKKHLTNYSQNKLKYKQESTADSIILPQTIFGLIAKEKGVDFRSQFYSKVEVMLSKLGLIFRGEVAFGSQNSFQLFGLDLLIDQALNLHLLQINLSAACEQRHEGLTAMLQDLGHGMLNILEEQEGQYQLRGWRVIK